MPNQSQITSLADLAGQTAEQSVRVGAMGLGLLLAEMQALGALMPGHVPTSEADARAHEAEVEAGFDNMPV